MATLAIKFQEEFWRKKHSYHGNMIIDQWDNIVAVGHEVYEMYAWLIKTILGSKREYP